MRLLAKTILWLAYPLLVVAAAAALIGIQKHGVAIFIFILPAVVLVPLIVIAHITILYTSTSSRPISLGSPFVWWLFLYGAWTGQRLFTSVYAALGAQGSTFYAAVLQSTLAAIAIVGIFRIWGNDRSGLLLLVCSEGLSVISLIAHALFLYGPAAYPIGLAATPQVAACAITWFAYRWVVKSAA